MISRLCLSLIAALLLFAPDALAAKREIPAGAKPNKLLNEASPYLRQHAYNPVNWYPWGEEAFEKAKRENKPVLLSVGYSTCHWCHVMERESYSDKDIAEILNLNFVAIKVDRERRPDVDETYMLATQLITRSGGWPNNVFMTPNRKPFHGGTYIPPGEFKDLLIQIAQLWEQDHKVLLGDAERVASAIDTVMTRRLDALALTPEALAKATSSILGDLDEFNGGFGDQLKFPQESVLLYLLWRAEKDNDRDALDAVTLTLDHMLNGGIQDHAGGGFHRYAVDPQWLVPHFEKMLYNQALITQVLLGAYRLTGNERYADAARRTLDYVLADMTAPEGGFYSARDADSEGEEGTFYVWRPEQLKEDLGKEDGELAAKVFGVDLLGNFERQTTVLHFPKPPEEIAADLKLDLPAFYDRVDQLRKRLAEARQKREAPHRDEKIVTAWNGMMVTAFAEAADVLGEPAYKAAAEKAAKFLWETLHHDGDLRRTWFEGAVSLDGQQEDYAYTALAFVSLYDLTGDQTWLERAEALTGEMVKRFRDNQAGDYYMTASINTFARMKARTDAGTPSGNAAALALFARLSRRSLDPEHKLNGEALLAALSGIALRAPSSSAYSLSSGDLLLRGGAGPRQFLAKGRVNARAALDKTTGKLTVTLDIAPGWHINSDKPLEEFFIPTELSVAGAKAGSVAYPEPIRRKLGFHDKELALYEGKADLTVPMPDKKDGPVTATLKLQACSDEICLEPETAVLTLGN